jgi:hypothetical protein
MRFGALRYLGRAWFFAPLILVLIGLVAARNVLFGVSFATFLDNTYMYLPLFSHAARVFTAGSIRTG